MIFPEEVKEAVRETYDGEKPREYDHQYLRTTGGLQITIPMMAAVDWGPCQCSSQK